MYVSEFIYLYTTYAFYNVSNNLFSTSALLSQGPPAKRSSFSHCFQDHPCSHLRDNCTHGHILDVQYGGQSQCYNCVPQDSEQQITHTLWQTNCFARGETLRVDTIPTSASCGFDFIYTCSAATLIFRSPLLILISVILSIVNAQSFSASAGYVRPLQASGLTPVHTRDSGIAFPYTSLRPECAYILTTNSIWPAECELPETCGSMLTKQDLPGGGFFGEKDICFRSPPVSRFFTVFQWSGGLPPVVLIPPYGSFSPDVTSMPLFAVDAPDNVCGIYRTSTAKHALHVRTSGDQTDLFFHDSVFNIEKECHWVNTTPAFDYVNCNGLWDHLPSGTVVANYHARDAFLSQVNITYTLIDQPVTTHGFIQHFTRLLDYTAEGSMHVTVDDRSGNYSSVHYVSTHLAHSVCTDYTAVADGHVVHDDSLRFVVASNDEVRIIFKTTDPNCDLWIRLSINNLYSNIQQCSNVYDSSPLRLFFHKYTALAVEIVLGDVLVSHEGVLILHAQVPSLQPGRMYLDSVGQTSWHLCDQLLVGRGSFSLDSPSFILKWYIFDPQALGFSAPSTVSEECVRNLRSLSDINWIEGLGLKFLVELERLLARVLTEVFGFLLTTIYESLSAFSTFILKFHLIEASILALLAQLQWHDVYLTAFIMGIMIIIFN